MTIADHASLLVVVAGLVAVLLATLIGQWRSGLTTALEFWVAAGLLRLAFDPGMDRIVSAAAIVAVRHLITFGLSASRGLGSAVSP